MSGLRLNCVSTNAITNIKPSAEAQQLYLIRFSKRVGHWGLFVPETRESKAGWFWDLRFNDFNNDAKMTKGTACAGGPNRKYRPRRQCWDLRRKNGSTWDAIEGARSTVDRMDSAANRVFRDFKYNVPFENCQTFLVDMMRMLNSWDPELVSKKAVDWVRSKTMLTVRYGSLIRQKTSKKKKNMVAERMMPYNCESIKPRHRHTNSHQSSMVTDSTCSLLPAQEPRPRWAPTQREVRAAGSYPAPRGTPTRRDANKNRSDPTNGPREARAVRVDPPLRETHRRRDPTQTRSDPTHGPKETRRPRNPREKRRSR